MAPAGAAVVGDENAGCGVVVARDAVVVVTDDEEHVGDWAGGGEILVGEKAAIGGHDDQVARSEFPFDVLNSDVAADFPILVTVIVLK